MVKKVFAIIFIFLFSAVLWADERKDGTVSFYFNTSKGYIEYTDMSDQSKDGINFTDGKTILDLKPGNYKFQFFSPSYFSVERIISISREYQSYNIDLPKKSGDFFVSVKKSSKNEIYFHQDPPDTNHILKDVSILFYKDGELLKTIYSDSFLKRVNLDFGQYDIVVKELDKTLMRIQRFPINEKYGEYLNFFIKPLEVFVDGFLKINDMYLGGADIIFTDVENNSYTLTSDFSGKFSGNVPPKKYKLSIKKFGYFLKEDNQLIYDFTDENNKFSLNLELEEAPSFIEGRIIDDRNSPVPYAEIVIKDGDIEKKSFADSFGRFRGTAKSGLVLIRVDKDGFFSNGLVRRIEKFSTISNLEIQLKRKLYKVSGVLSDGVKPIKSQKIDLISPGGKRIASTLSGENGYFEFLDIPATDIFKVSVKISDFKPYSSPEISLKEDINNFNIIMNRGSRQVILEITDNSDIPIKNSPFTLDNKIIKSDSNGIISYQTPSEEINLLYKNQKKKISLEKERSVYKIQLNQKDG
ncbi:carboxypeptidase-like regulatory domain-containing protein [uncultured Ilyobacter sp.]|uniref:carboxypeptidase-like regulatory domain-containing protein n=1 Tax=uncultured Ilyobacter sp. TaxID=544433 RepID=UPI0029C725A2|nr:carboxypeptidase-like regulatory domain-containing protein [uncultured Ilyobacter sp.]